MAWALGSGAKRPVLVSTWVDNITGTRGLATAWARLRGGVNQALLLGWAIAACQRRICTLCRDSIWLVGLVTGQGIACLRCFFARSLLARLFLCTAHVVHLPKGKNKNQSKNAQFQPDPHGATFPFVSVEIDSLDYQVILTVMPVSWC